MPDYEKTRHVSSRRDIETRLAATDQLGFVRPSHFLESSVGIGIKSVKFDGYVLQAAFPEIVCQRLTVGIVQVFGYASTKIG